FKIGKANVLKKGDNVCIFSTGLMVYPSLQAAEQLEKQGIKATVVNIHTIKPIDKECILEMAKKHDFLFSVEEHSVIGGLGSAIAEVLIKENPKKLNMIGIQDTFGESGKPNDLLDYHGLTAEKIAQTIAKGLQ
ncbi:MAG: transketolase C-terminal domain-containing protein, partial [Brevinema sp.]